MLYRLRPTPPPLRLPRPPLLLKSTTSTMIMPKAMHTQARMPSRVERRVSGFTSVPEPMICGTDRLMELTSGRLMVLEEDSGSLICEDSGSLESTIDEVFEVTWEVQVCGWECVGFVEEDLLVLEVLLELFGFGLGFGSGVGSGSGSEFGFGDDGGGSGSEDEEGGGGSGSEVEDGGGSVLGVEDSFV